MRILLIMALLWASPVRQADLAVAGMEGVVTTDGGAPLPGVKIAMDGLAKPIHLETLSNTAGQYTIANVPPGAYTIAAEAKGFGCVIIPKLALEGGKRSKQDFEFLHARRKLGCPTEKGHVQQSSRARAN
jgi:hypothetical protein